MRIVPFSTSVLIGIAMLSRVRALVKKKTFKVGHFYVSKGVAF